MANHKFELHQMVRLAQGRLLSGQRLSPSGLYEVTRLMPQDVAGSFHYRVTSAAGERVVREDQITPRHS